MIDKFLRAIDEQQRAAMSVAVQPLTDNIEYTAGLRIGVSIGIQRARKAMLDTFNDQNSKDKDL